MVDYFQNIVTKAIYCYNSGVHEFLRLVVVEIPPTLPEPHGLFPPFTQGDNLGELYKLL